MSKNYRTVVIILVLVILFLLAWYFRYLVSCGIIALILTFIGRPFMQLLERIKYKKFRVGNGLAAAITLILMVAVIVILFREFFPLLIRQIGTLSSINIDNILQYYEEPINKITVFLADIGLINNEETLQSFIYKKGIDFIQKGSFSTVINELFSFTWNLVLAIFTILFFTFFMLKENGLVKKGINAVVPNEYLGEVNHITDNSKKLISRYIIGLCVEIIFLTAVLSICFSIFGFPNALLIAFCCGCMVIIPYLGVIIGGGLGLIILVTTMISADPSINIIPIIIKYVITFACVKVVDDFVIQPFIYSRSVKAHPLEIFIVIMVSGKLGGILGMILAVPTYTLIRIIAKEFFNSSKLVQSFTKNL